jgi:hypothetical protein
MGPSRPSPGDRCPTPVLLHRHEVAGMTGRDIHLEDAPQRRRDVTEVVQDGEATIYEPDGLQIHGLNSIATTLWHCMDGSVTLERLAADLADVYDEDLDVTRAHVLGYARDLARRGLLQGSSFPPAAPDT